MDLTTPEQHRQPPYTPHSGSSFYSGATLAQPEMLQPPEHTIRADPSSPPLEISRPTRAPSTNHYLPTVDSVPDPKNWKELLPNSSITYTHTLTPPIEHLYQVDIRKQGPLFQPTVSSAVYFLVHTTPTRTEPLDLVLFANPGDSQPSTVVPMQKLEGGRYFVGINDGGKSIGEGTRFAYRNRSTGELLADPYAYELSEFRWTQIPGRNETPSAKHHDPLHCIVRQDPLEAAIRDRQGKVITPAPSYTDIRTVKVHPRMTTDLTDQQLGAGFEGTQGTLKALQSPWVQEHLLKGFNQVEFFPINAFGTEVPTFYGPDGKLNPHAENVWGFMPISHFAIEPRVVSDKSNPWREVIETIDSLHRGGFRVAFDVVPHSFESNDDPSYHFKGPTLNFRGLDREGYYATYPDGRLRDHSGCGNAFRFTPAQGRSYTPNSLESIVGEGGAYFFRAAEGVFRLGADIRIDQGIMIGRDRRGEFNPEARSFHVLSQIANEYGCRITAETGDCGSSGPGSYDWLRIEPYAPTARVYPESKIRTQDFFGGREIPRDAMGDARTGMIRSVANVFNGNGVSYSRNQLDPKSPLAYSYRVLPVSPHDGHTLYDDMKIRLERSNARCRHHWNAEQNLLLPGEDKLGCSEKDALIERRIVSTAALGVEFLTTFSPSEARIWSYGAQYLASQGGNHNAYDKPEFCSRSFAEAEPWQKQYAQLWLKKEALREELGLFSHSRFLGAPALIYFDGTGHCMNRGSDYETDVRWSTMHSPQVLSAWYSGREMNKHDVLVTWCSGPKRDLLDPVYLPDPGKNENGEQYVWLRRANSSALVNANAKEVFEPAVVATSRGVHFQAGGVQVFQRMTEGEAKEFLSSYQ